MLTTENTVATASTANTARAFATNTIATTLTPTKQRQVSICAQKKSSMDTVIHLLCWVHREEAQIWNWNVLINYERRRIGLSKINLPTDVFEFAFCY